MKKFLQQIPIPICGLILGVASLGNLLKEYDLIVLGNFLGVIALIMLILIILKVMITFPHIKKNLKDPIIASVSPTFTMATMVLCTYLSAVEVFMPFIRIAWLISIAIHYCLVAYFVYNFLIKPNITIEHLYPSWFIVFVGIGVISVTSTNFSLIIGELNFWVGLISYLFLLPIVIHRVFIIKNMPEPTLPLITIIAAPGSLILTGYLKAFVHPNLILVFFLLILSQVIYWFILTRVIKIIKLSFYPSYAAFTFPLVISAMAITITNKYLHSLDIYLPFIDYLTIIETIIASMIIVYVIIKYSKYFKSIFITCNEQA